MPGPTSGRWIVEASEPEDWPRRRRDQRGGPPGWNSGSCQRPCHSDQVKQSLLGTATHHVSHTAAKVPRILGAARGAGASTTDAVRLLALSTLVLLEATRRSRGRPWRENAVRHFAWQALLAARHGTSVAESVAAANEAGSTDTLDSAIDERNNAAGRAWATTHQDELTGVPLPQAVRRAFEEATRRWDVGELARPKHPR